MGFLRQNVFLLGVIVCVLVIGGMLVAMDAGASGEVDRMVAERTKLAGGLRMVNRPPLVNRRVVAARQQYVEQVRAASDQVRVDSIVWNKRNYNVIELAVEGKDVAAFPIDSALYKRHSLKLTFTETYLDELWVLLETLGATTKADPEEISEEETRVQDVLRRRKESESLDEGAPDVRPATPYRPGPVIAPLGRSRGPSVAAGQTRSEPEARKIATELVQIRHAKAGRIYASWDSFRPTFTEPDVNPSEAKLWEAQVNLWVTQDIIAAINKTNQQAFYGGGNEVRKPNVLNAAVKRLVSLEVVDSSGASSASARPGISRAPAISRTAQPTARSPRRAAAARAARLAASASGQGAESLTRRASGQEYDVVSYTVTLVMPTRYLQSLQASLMERNFHTVTRVEMEPVSADDEYYYGPEGVMEVTLSGQLLLLTDWTRGTWDSQQRQWSSQYPPIIPHEVLLEMQKTSPAALRNEDVRRISADTNLIR